MRGGLTFAATLAAAALAGAAGARTRYVAPAGSDAAPGDADRPFRTFARATAGLTAGDRLVVRPGRYTQPLIIAASGAPGRPITVQGEGWPLIEAGYDAVTLAGSWIVLDGVEAHAPGEGSAIRLAKGAHHLRVAHSIARASGCGGVAGEQNDYVEIVSDRVFGNGRRARYQCSGVSLYQPVAVDGRAGVHNLIENNVVYDNMNVVPPHPGQATTDGNGIILDDCDHTQGDLKLPPYTAVTLVRNNRVFDNGGRGVHVFHCSHVAVLGNVAWRDLKDTHLQRPAGELSAAFSAGVTMADNIAVARPGQLAAVDAYAAGANAWDYNLIDGGPSLLAIRSAARAGPHTLADRDPGFSSAAPGEGFRLRPGSFARNAGVVVRLDAAGRPVFTSRPADLGPTL